VAMVTDELAALRREVDVLLDLGDTRSATECISRVWEMHAGPSTAGFVNGRLARLPRSGRRAASVAILRSFTVEPLVPLLQAAAGVTGLDLTVQVGSFNAVVQDLLDPNSPVYSRWNPDVTIVAIQTRDIAPEIWDGFGDLATTSVDAIVSRVVGEFASVVEAFGRQGSGVLVVHTLELPRRRAFGVADDQLASHGQTETIEAINHSIRSIARAQVDVIVLNYDSVIANVGRANWYDDRKWASSRMPMRSDCMMLLVDEWMRILQPSVGRIAKVLVTDLDNTLWDGVVGEDGLAGIGLGDRGAGAGYKQLQRDIRDLRGRGVLLGIASKNTLEEHMVLGMGDFSAVRINWVDKATNLREIAAELNVGLDAIAFLDDSPAECALVRAELPEVLVLEMDRPPTENANPISGCGYFERLTVTGEDRRRAEMYSSEGIRRHERLNAGSLEDYLHSLSMTVTVSVASPGETARVAQLTQKTNQFNLTTKRYTVSEIADLAQSSESLVLAALAVDRFGDHGLIGVVILHTGLSWEVDTMLLSCRVIGRGVETAIMSAVVRCSRENGATSIRASFTKTAKNIPASDFLRAHGFEQFSDDGQTSRWKYEKTSKMIQTPSWIRLVDRVGDFNVE
jgi:FkbH-like protein